MTYLAAIANLTNETVTIMNHSPQITDAAFVKPTIVSCSHRTDQIIRRACFNCMGLYAKDHSAG